jgi:cytochrome c-type biogenesis protein CcmH/NrfF
MVNRTLLSRLISVIWEFKTQWQGIGEEEIYKRLRGEQCSSVSIRTSEGTLSKVIRSSLYTEVLCLICRF